MGFLHDFQAPEGLPKVQTMFWEPRVIFWVPHRTPTPITNRWRALQTGAFSESRWSGSSGFEGLVFRARRLGSCRAQPVSSATAMKISKKSDFRGPRFRKQRSPATRDAFPFARLRRVKLRKVLVAGLRLSERCGLWIASESCHRTRVTQ